MALVGKTGIREAVAQHHFTACQRGLDALLQMVAPRRKNQQRLGHCVHRIMQKNGSQLFSHGRSAWFAGQSNHPALPSEQLGQALDMGGFPGTINALETDENSASGHAVIRGHAGIC